MSPAEGKPVVMGRVFAPFGLKGWIHVTPFTEEPGALLDFRRWWIGGEAMEVIEGKLQGKGLVAHLAGITDRDQAALLKGRDIAVPRNWLPAAGEGQVYWADLIGLAVQNEAGDVLGEVVEVFSNGGHEVLRVGYREADTPKEFLVPLVGEYLLEVDVPGGVIRVDWQRDW